MSTLLATWFPSSLLSLYRQMRPSSGFARLIPAPDRPLRRKRELEITWLCCLEQRAVYMYLGTLFRSAAHGSACIEWRDQILGSRQQGVTQRNRLVWRVRCTASPASHASLLFSIEALKSAPLNASCTANMHLCVTRVLLAFTAHKYSAS